MGPSLSPNVAVFLRRNSTALAASGLSRAKCVMRWLALIAKVNPSGTCDAQSWSTLLGQAVERVVDLDRRIAARVELEHRVVLEVLRVEQAPSTP